MSELRVVETPVTAEQINSILLRRAENARLDVNELRGKVFARLIPDTDTFELVTIPANKPLDFQDLIGLTNVFVPYPSPIINILRQPEVFAESVTANDGTQRFTTRFSVDWRQSEWPTFRERGANDILRLTVTAQAYIRTEEESEFVAAGDPVTILNTTDTTYDANFTARFDYDTSAALTDLDDSLTKYMYFELVANLFVREFNDELGLQFPDENYTTLQVTNVGSMELKIFQLDDSNRPYIWLNRFTSDAPITYDPEGFVIGDSDQDNFAFYTSNLYKRTIDDTVAISTPVTFRLSDYYQFIPETPGRDPKLWRTNIEYAYIEGTYRYDEDADEAGFGGIFGSSGGIRGLFSGLTLDEEFLRGENDDGIMEFWPPSRGMVHYDKQDSDGSEFFLKITPKTDAWSGYSFRAYSVNNGGPQLFLSNPDQTVKGINSSVENIPISVPGFGPSNTFNNNSSGRRDYFVNVQLKDPEYVLPDPNTVAINAIGIPGAIRFHTRWTGEADRIYYWRIESVTSTTTPVATAFSTVTGSFTNSENLLQQPGDADFNFNDIPLDINNIGSSSNYRLSVYNNAGFTDRVATTVFSLITEPAEIQITAMQFGLQAVVNDPENVNIEEGVLFTYGGIANWYGEGRTLKWSYNVVTDVGDSGDLPYEFVDGADNPYYPDTAYLITTTDAPPTFISGSADGASRTAFFELPTLRAVDDSDGIGDTGSAEEIVFTITDDSDNIQDQVTMFTRDLLQDGLEFTQDLPLIQTSSIVAVTGTNYYENGASGTLAFTGTPYIFRNTAGELLITGQEWQRYNPQAGAWQSVPSENTSWTDPFGNIQTGTRTVTATGTTFSIEYADWVTDIAASFLDESYRLAVSVRNNVTGITTVYTSDPGTIRIPIQYRSITPGIIEAQLMYTPGAGEQILEGYSPVRLYMRIFGVPGGTEVEYKITDNANILPPYATWNGDPVLPTTGTVTVPAGGTGLRNVFVDLPGIYPFLAHYTDPVQEYLQVRIVDPDSIGISGAGVQYGDIGNTQDPRFPSATSAPSLSIRTTDWSDHPELWEVKVGDTFLNLLNSVQSPWTVKDGYITIDEDQTASLPIEIIAQNVEPDAQAQQWFLIIGGDATRYFQNLSDVSLERDPDLRGIALDALDFDNAATSATLKAGGRYRMGTSIQLDGPDATIDTDVTGFIGIGRIVPALAGEFYTYIWSEPLKIVNTVPAPWDPAEGANQLAVVAGSGSISEGETVRFFVFDKAKSDNPAYADYDDATPIPAGTTIYAKVSGRVNFTVADFTTDPPQTIVQNGLTQVIELTMRADGNAGPVDVTLVEDDGYEDSEQFRLIANNIFADLAPATQLSASSSWVTAVNTDPFPANYGMPSTLSVRSLGQANNIGTETISGSLSFSSDGTYSTSIDRYGSTINNSGDWITGTFTGSDYSLTYSGGSVTGSGVLSVTGSGINRTFELVTTGGAGRPAQGSTTVTITIRGPAGITTTTVNFSNVIETR